MSVGLLNKQNSIKTCNILKLLSTFKNTEGNTSNIILNSAMHDGKNEPEMSKVFDFGFPPKG